jgi:hypothetical protein
MPNPSLPDRPEYDHQIDLYWEEELELTKYVNIVNAKWRGTRKVEQGEVLLLKKVAENVKAHKAVMITNSGFTEGARAVVESEGAALHVVRPQFNYASLERKDRALIRTQIQALAGVPGGTMYTHEIEFKAFDLAERRNEPPRAPALGHPGWIVTGGYENKMIGGPPANKAGGGGISNKAVGPPSSGRGGGPRGGGSETK